MTTGRMRWMRRIIGAGLALTVLALFLGYLGFARTVGTYADLTAARADGIVVLTGGEARITAALELLAEGRAERLLISGVNRNVDAGTLAANLPENARLLSCCVDLGYRALDTVGNAAETRAWAGASGYGSLIVVTSDYHMPRSLLELSQALPGVRLVPHAVSAGRPTLRLVTSEYAKYMVSTARHIVAAPLQRGVGTPARADEAR